MFQDTRPAGLDADGGICSFNEFRVEHPTEIVALLRQLRDRVQPVHLNSPEGYAQKTTLWSIDDSRGRLNFTVDTSVEQAQNIVNAAELTAVAYLDNVKLQFDVQGVTLVRSFQAATLQTALPREVYRFQRRNSFRVRTPEPFSPTAHLRHPSMPEMTLSLRMLDISIGGCALQLPADVPPLQPGTQVDAARVELDIDTALTLKLQLQHVAVLGPGRGARIGCAWRDLNPGAERALQRFIDQTQKRLRLMARD